MKINGAYPITFKYSSILKTLFNEDKLPTVTKGFYGGNLSKIKDISDSVTLEHLQPHSKGGKTNLSNLVLATFENNNKRGSEALGDVFVKEKAKEYLEQFDDLMVQYEKKGKIRFFDGNRYKMMIIETVNKILEKEGKLDLLG